MWKIKKTIQEFLSQARQVHGNKYNYDNVIYINGQTKVQIGCPEHGDFFQRPNDHINRKSKCPKCKPSYFDYYNATNLIGKRFERLVVISFEGTRSRKAQWKCHCDCGSIIITSGTNLISGGTKSCGCYKKDHHFKLRPYEWLYNSLKKKTRRECSLTYEEFLQFTQITSCHYCNDHIDWGLPNGQRGSSAYYLDRIDNSLGYTKKNCVVCCSPCNWVKGHFLSYNEMKELGPSLRKLWDKRK